MRRAQRAQLALLLEVSGTPKPGNVDRVREYSDLRFEHFLAGAVSAYDGLAMAADPGGPPIGEAFEHAVAGMSQQGGGNTQFGALLLIVPLVRAGAVSESELTSADVTGVVEATTVEDAAGFYRAFEHVDVSVPDPPADATAVDVRRGADAVSELRKRDFSLYDVMELSQTRDGVACEWTGGFERSFRTAERLATMDGPITDRAARAYLELLAEDPDTFVVTQHDERTAAEVRDRARDLLDTNADRDAIETFADSLVDRDINPGTTADVTAAGLYIALERGAIRV